jgi:hypothetical protein
MGPQFRSFYHVFSHKTPYMIEIVLLVKLIKSLLCNLITRNLLNQKKKLWLCECNGCVYWVRYLWFYYWVFTSTDGLLVPEGVICPVVSVSVLTLCITYLWHTQNWKIGKPNNFSFGSNKIKGPKQAQVTYVWGRRNLVWLIITYVVLTVLHQRFLFLLLSFLIHYFYCSES